MEVIAKGGVGSSQISRRDVGLVVASRGPGAIVCFETAPGKNRISYQSLELYAAYLVGGSLGDKNRDHKSREHD